MIKRYFRIALFSLILLLVSATTYAECIINAKTNKNKVIVGDEVNLSITLKYRDGEPCALSEDISLPKFRILKKDVKSEKSDSYTIDTYVLTLVPLELGDVTIPSIRVNIIQDAGPNDEDSGLSTPEIKINVQGVISNEKEAVLKDILPPEKVYERTYLLLYIIGGLLALSLLIYLVVRYIRKRRSKVAGLPSEERPLEPLLPPYEEAIQSLKRLEEERLISKYHFKEFYLALTEILKRFIERFYGFNALEMTTYELTVYLLDHPQPNLDFANLKDFLEVADLVKFAKFTPDVESAYRDFNRVREIIDRAACRLITSESSEGQEKR